MLGASLLKKLEAINSLPLVEYSINSGEVEYVYVENSETNRKILLSAGFTEVELDDKQICNDDTVDIAYLAFNSGATWFDQLNGFSTEDALYD
jgi:hypothetical protein